MVARRWPVPGVALAAIRPQPACAQFNRCPTVRLDGFKNIPSPIHAMQSDHDERAVDARHWEIVPHERFGPLQFLQSYQGICELLGPAKVQRPSDPWLECGWDGPALALWFHSERLASVSIQGSAVLWGEEVFRMTYDQIFAILSARCQDIAEKTVDARCLLGSEYSPFRKMSSQELGLAFYFEEGSERPSDVRVDAPMARLEQWPRSRQWWRPWRKEGIS